MVCVTYVVTNWNVPGVRCKMAVIDQVKIRVRTHAPNHVEEKEFSNVTEAVAFLGNYHQFILTTPDAYVE